MKRRRNEGGKQRAEEKGEGKGERRPSSLFTMFFPASFRERVVTLSPAAGQRQLDCGLCVGSTFGLLTSSNRSVADGDLANVIQFRELAAAGSHGNGVFQSTEPIAGSWVAQQPWLCCLALEQEEPLGWVLGSQPWGGGEAGLTFLEMAWEKKLESNDARVLGG